MPVFLVTWNLNKEHANYPAARNAFIDHLNRYANIADPGLESVRFVSTTKSASDLSADLKLKLDDNDRLFVTRLRQSEHAGWLHKDVWAWIDKHL